MTRIYRYTDGATAGSISGATPFAFGTSRARPTTRAGLYDEVVLAMVAAGWTQFNIATRDDVWYSNGESSSEDIYVRTKYLVPGTPTTQNSFNFFVGTKQDGVGTNNLLGQIGTVSSGLTLDGWFTSADTTFDFQCFATKDFVWFNARVVTTAGNLTANQGLNFFLGQLERANTVLGNTKLSAGASAGTNVVLSVTVNPISLGYRVGDYIQIVEIGNTIGAAQAHTLRIVGLTSTTITVENLPVTYTNAVLGQIPMPTVRYVGKEIDADTITNWTSPLAVEPSNTQASEVVGGNGLVLERIHASVGAVVGETAFGTGTSTANATANKRRGRFGLRNLTLGLTGVGIYGRVPGLYVFPGASTLAFFPHDTGTDNTVSPSARYVSARFLSSSTKPWMLGKMP